MELPSPIVCTEPDSGGCSTPVGLSPSSDPRMPRPTCRRRGQKVGTVGQPLSTSFTLCASHRLHLQGKNATECFPAETKARNPLSSQSQKRNGINSFQIWLRRNGKPASGLPSPALLRKGTTFPRCFCRSERRDRRPSCSLQARSGCLGEGRGLSQPVRESLVTAAEAAALE